MLDDLLPFTIAAVLLTLSPGPDTMLVLRNTLRGGRPDGIRTTLGVCAGLLVHATLSAVGLSVILVRSATLFNAVKLVGAAYLVWLGVGALRDGLGNVQRAARSVQGDSASRRRPFREGLLTNVLNPKVAVFYLAFLPQFIGPGDPVLARSLVLAAIHNASGLVWLALLAAGTSRARGFITRESVRRWLDGICGAVLVALGVKLALVPR
jgi:RhtB (resistance to homoserine/threonine) family protein